MYKTTASLFFTAIFSTLFVLMGCSTADDRYQLRLILPNGKHTLEVAKKVHHVDNGLTVFALSTEETWDVVAQLHADPENVLLELKKKFFSVQYRPLQEHAFDFIYDSNQSQPMDGIPPIHAGLIGPKPGTKLNARIGNNFQEFENVRIIEHGDLNDSYFKTYYTDDFSVLNGIQNLLPKERVKVGDRWERPVINPMPSFGKFPEPVIAVVTLDKIEKAENNIEIAIISVKIGSPKDRSTDLFGNMILRPYSDAAVSSEGSIVLNTSSGFPILYTVKTKIHYTSIGGDKREEQEEYVWEFCIPE